MTIMAGACYVEPRMKLLPILFEESLKKLCHDVKESCHTRALRMALQERFILFHAEKQCS